MLKKTKNPRNVEMDFVSPVCEPLKQMYVDHAWWSPLRFPLFKKNLAGLTTSFGTCIVYSLVQNKNKKNLNKLTNSVRSKQYYIFSLFYRIEFIHFTIKYIFAKVRYIRISTI